MRRPVKYVMPDPPMGTTRVKRVFAWRPQIIVDTIIWLEYYEILQVFAYFEYPILTEGKPKSARTSKWIDLESRLIT